MRQLPSFAPLKNRQKKARGRGKIGKENDGKVKEKFAMEIQLGYMERHWFNAKEKRFLMSCSFDPDL